MLLHLHLIQSPKMASQDLGAAPVQGRSPHLLNSRISCILRGPQVNGLAPSGLNHYKIHKFNSWAFANILGRLPDCIATFRIGDRFLEERLIKLTPLLKPSFS